jgi:hypothetical protein
MTVDAVAEHFGIASKTVYQNWKDWGLAAVRIGGGSSGPLRFRRQEVEKLERSWERHE